MEKIKQKVDSSKIIYEIDKSLTKLTRREHKLNKITADPPAIKRIREYYKELYAYVKTYKK